MKTGYAIIVAGFFVGAAIMFAGADIAHAMNRDGGPSSAGGAAFALFGGLGLLMHYNALQAKKKKQSQALGD
jgi:hypothetical protein